MVFELYSTKAIKNETKCFTGNKKRNSNSEKIDKPNFRKKVIFLIISNQSIDIVYESQRT
jgi:hypothetical protein